jgi:GxxExxY protein
MSANVTSDDVSHQDTKNTKNDLNQLSKFIVNAAYKIHLSVGPGLLESVYERLLAHELEKLGLKVERQKIITFKYEGMIFDEGFRADLLVESGFLVELKSVEKLMPVHGKQLLTYLRLMNLPLGLLINFGAATFQEGISRIINGTTTFAVPPRNDSNKG